MSAANGQGKLKLSINFTRIFVNFDCNCSFDSNCNCDYNCNWTAVITASISCVKVSFNGMQAINNLFSALNRCLDMTRHFADLHVAFRYASSNATFDFSRLTQCGEYSHHIYFQR